MKRCSLLILISIFLVHSCVGQERDSILQIGLSIMSQVEKGNNYITFPNYNGADYYNIYFSHQLSVLQLMTTGK